MRRTQIYIDDATFSFLQKESKLEKRTISEIIRDSIREKIARKNSGIISKMDAVFGTWSDRKINVHTYVRRLRKDRKI